MLDLREGGRIIFFKRGHTYPVKKRDGGGRGEKKTCLSFQEGVIGHWGRETLRSRKENLERESRKPTGRKILPLGMTGSSVGEGRVYA